MAWSTPSVRSTSDLITAAIWNQDIVNNPIALSEGAIIVTMDGNTYELSTGIAARFSVPKDLTITQVTLLADQTGSIVIDIWKDTYANYPPTDADTITGGSEPTIAAALKYQDGTLSGWTTALSSGDTIIVNIDSVTTITYCTMILKVQQA